MSPSPPWLDYALAFAGGAAALSYAIAIYLWLTDQYVRLRPRSELPPRKEKV